MEYASTVLYKKWVLDANLHTPMNENEILFRMAGFNGCIGSSDVSRNSMLCCANWAQIMHKVFKLNIPSLKYNMTVNHCCKCLGQ